MNIISLLDFTLEMTSVSFLYIGMVCRTKNIISHLLFLPGDTVHPEKSWKVDTLRHQRNGVQLLKGVHIG